MAQIEWAIYFTYPIMFCYAWAQNCAQHLPLQNLAPLHSNTLLQHSTATPHSIEYTVPN